MRLCLILLALMAGEPQPAPEIRWEFGPLVKDAGPAARVSIPKGLIWAGGKEARRFLEFTGNPASGGEAAIAGPVRLDWFAVITWRTYESLGFDAKRPDPAQIADAIRLGSASANLDRRHSGRESLEIVDWAERPVFHAETGRLEFVLHSQESGGRQVANRFTYLLGRRGLIEIELVSEQGADTSSAGRLIDAFTWRPGESYEDSTGTRSSWVAALAAALAAALGIRMWRQRGQ